MRTMESCNTVHAQNYLISGKGKGGIKALEFDDVHEVMKVCTVLGSGTLQIVLGNEKFEIGFGGIFRIRNGESCTISGDGFVSVVTLS